MAHLTVVALSLLLAGGAIQLVMSLSAHDVTRQPGGATDPEADTGR